MPRAQRICGRPGCPKPIAKRYCVTHDAEYEAKRGNSNKRGYGAAHRRTRASLAEVVARGDVPCARCGRPILATDTWALDHDDEDRSRYLGPSHTACNNSAGGKNAHAKLER